MTGVKTRVGMMTVLALVGMTALGCGRISSGWRAELDDTLALYGHRNWIVIADSAYPAQSRPGIQTIATGAGQLETVEAVLKAVDKAPHVRPIIYVDAEMRHVSEADAPGIGAYRDALHEILGDRPVEAIPHEELIAKLDEAAKVFSILILKTELTLPYTSVFVQLDCGYWGGDAEKRLRQKIAARKRAAKGPQEEAKENQQKKKRLKQRLEQKKRTPEDKAQEKRGER
ncbi:MAG TPA: RbsD/FucU domain-containing protein [Sumerlaeia bacterium]|nr:RbsD/FucU domain-containing protein [Sumerlaeia bacterium]